MAGPPVTRGVETLLGEPKRAILRLAGPMIVAMSVQSLYNVADALWVAGLGSTALAAVGFFFPFFFLSMALANGIGLGAGTAISRAIGAGDKPRADRVASHALFLLLAAVVLFTAPMVVFTRPILAALGAVKALDDSTAYARIMFSGSLLFFFANVANNLLRSEGDAKRAMHAMLTGALLNIALDPLFIYGFGLGVAGAAYASLTGMLGSGLLLASWLFLRKNTWVTFRLRGFRPRAAVLREIARVGVPASVMHGSMFLMVAALTKIVSRVGGGEGVAVYTTGWRVVSLAILPMLGIATSTTAVCGAAYGAKDPAKLRTSYVFSLKAGVLFELALAVATFALAPLIARAFTWSEDSAAIRPALTTFLRILWIFYPTVAVGMISSSAFQGMGRGTTALAMTILRTLVFTVPASWFIAITLGGGLTGVWWGIVAAHVVYAPVAFVWATGSMRRWAAGLVIPPEAAPASSAAR